MLWSEQFCLSVASVSSLGRCKRIKCSSSCATGRLDERNAIAVPFITFFFFADDELRIFTRQNLLDKNMLDRPRQFCVGGGHTLQSLHVDAVFTNQG